MNTFLPNVNGTQDSEILSLARLIFFQATYPEMKISQIIARAQICFSWPHMRPIVKTKSHINKQSAKSTCSSMDGSVSAPRVFLSMKQPVPVILHPG